MWITKAIMIAAIFYVAVNAGAISDFISDVGGMADESEKVQALEEKVFDTLQRWADKIADNIDKTET